MQAAQLRQAMIPLQGLPPSPPAWRHLTAAAAAAAAVAAAGGGGGGARGVVQAALSWRQHLVPDVEGASGAWLHDSSRPAPLSVGTVNKAHSSSTLHITGSETQPFSRHCTWTDKPEPYLTSILPRVVESYCSENSGRLAICFQENWTRCIHKRG